MSNENLKNKKVKSNNIVSEKENKSNVNFDEKNKNNRAIEINSKKTNDKGIVSTNIIKGKNVPKNKEIIKKQNILSAKYLYKPKSEYTIKLKSVKKNFGSKKILKGINISIKKGERVALIGKNGSGKSTLINIISQQLRISNGQITYGYAKNRVESLELMGIQFQTLNYPEGFVVEDVIHFFNVSVEKSIRMSRKELSDMMFMFGIDKFLDQKIDRLSGGQQQRINILLALIKKPKLLILDEISTGLDIESAETIKEYIESYLERNPSTTLLLISHSAEEIREMTDRLYILENGKITEEFKSIELSEERFLDITSREPKLSKEEKEQVEKESEKYLKDLKKYYKVGEKSKFRKNIETKIEKRKSKLKVDDKKSASKIEQKNKNPKIQKQNKIFENFKKLIELDNSLMEKGNIIEIRDVSKTYSKKVGAVRNMNLDIVDGSRIAITGPNGSGKTTIVEIIAKVKTFDHKWSKYKNMLNLAKSDFEREDHKLTEALNLEVRKLKSNYRFQRNIAQIEIDDLNNEMLKKQKEAKLKLKKNYKGKFENEIKIIKDKHKVQSKIAQSEIKDLNAKMFEEQKEAKAKLDKSNINYKEILEKSNEKIKAKFEKDIKDIKNNHKLKSDIVKSEIEKINSKMLKKQKEAKENIVQNKEIYKEKLKESSERIKEKFENEIKDKKTKIDKYVDSEKLKIEVVEKKLRNQLEIDRKKLKVDYDVEHKRILSERKESKNQKGYMYSKPHIENGVNTPGKEFINNKPFISYSFANTTRQVKDNTGVQFQYASFPVEMSVLDVILFFARTNKYFMPQEEMIEAVKVFKLEKLLKSKAYKLSGGERQRLNVLLAIMKSPKLLILDEISTGLDVDSIVKIDAFIKKYLDKTGATLILISHNYHEVHSLTDRIIVMRYGELSEIVETKGWTLQKTKNKMRDIYKGSGL